MKNNKSKKPLKIITVRTIRLFHYLLMDAPKPLTTAELVNDWDEIFGLDDSMKDLSKRRAIERSLERISQVLADDRLQQLFIYHDEYIDSKDYFSIEYNGATFINNQEALVLVKSFLASRALNDEEATTIINKWQRTISNTARKTIKLAVKENYDNQSYIIDGKDREETIWRLEKYIEDRSNIGFSYQNKEVSGSPIVDEKILPIHVFFDNYYFFLKGYTTVNNRLQYKTYRIDWIKDITKIKPRINLNGQNRIQNSEEDPKSLFAYDGEEKRIEFEYYGFPDYIYDKFPQLELDKEEPDKPRKFGFSVRKMRVKVNYSDGVKMWLLSQATVLKVISPPEVVADLRNLLEDGIKMYPKKGDQDEISTDLDSKA